MADPIQHASDCAVHDAPAYPAGECNCGGAVPLLPSVDVAAVHNMANALIERSSKFQAFFSRAELEAHLAIAAWPVAADITASQEALLREAVEHIRNLTSLERIVAPDMGGKRRTYAMMQSGPGLADTLDAARAFLTKMEGRG